MYLPLQSAVFADSPINGCQSCEQAGVPAATQLVQRFEEQQELPVDFVCTAAGAALAPPEAMNCSTSLRVILSAKPRSCNTRQIYTIVLGKPCVQLVNNDHACFGLSLPQIAAAA